MSRGSRLGWGRTTVARVTLILPFILRHHPIIALCKPLSSSSSSSEKCQHRSKTAMLDMAYVSEQFSQIYPKALRHDQRREVPPCNDFSSWRKATATGPPKVDTKGRASATIICVANRAYSFIYVALSVCQGKFSTNLFRAPQSKTFKICGCTQTPISLVSLH
ncbi:hypothetical protein K469DRAFT_162035 [Zopfia rhizophila CBS 207.26]|uniref:Uncharacterized protein n=1 Tax=Zopfia rhizophila CBS 207.26 TaxID=1314779 RepID=A0A6A6E3K0_9PEZI|nr:hypothetical protein K469DRAFT_162035 [Zopfia rhizophila CBS 207.26]